MSTTLLDVQRRMAAAVMEPLTAADTLRPRRLDGVVMTQEAPEFIKPSATLSSLERLEIYNRQYWFRLFDSFEDDFPGLKAVLGQKRFERLTRAYIADCPSTSYTLRDLGARLFDWIVEHEGFTGADHVLAQDMVRFEWARIEAYDGASYPTLAPEYLASITGETCLGLQPCVRLLALSYPVDEFLVRLRQDVHASSDASSNNASATRKLHPVRRKIIISAMPIWLAVHRQDFTVYYKRLQREEFQMLIALQSGQSLDEVFSAEFLKSSVSEDDRPRFIQECFSQWTTLSWLFAPNSSHVSNDLGVQR
jgi:hypothetical protein